MNYRCIRFFMAALLLGTALVACGVLGNKPAPPLLTYTVSDSALASNGVNVPVGARVLIVDMPRAVAGFESKRMVYVRHPLTQEAFANSAWSDTPARMLAPLLAARLQRSGQFRAVLLAPSTAKADWRLETTVLRLEQDFLHQPSSAHFTLQLTVLDNSTREVIAWHTLDVEHAAPSEDAAGGAAAANAAVQEGLTQIDAFMQRLDKP
jgi:cholesterol transport system auxiliary component